MRIVMWKSKDGWRVRMQAKNGRILLSSEAYSRWGKARHMVNLLRKVFSFPVVIRVPKKKREDGKGEWKHLSIITIDSESRIPRRFNNLLSFISDDDVKKNNKKKGGTVKS